MNQRVPYDFLTENPDHSTAPNIQMLWDQMQQKLDQEMPVKKDDRWNLLFWQIAASFILIITVSLIYVNHGPLAKNNSNSEIVSFSRTTPKSSNSEFSLNKQSLNQIPEALNKEHNEKNAATSKVTINKKLNVQLKKLTALNKRSVNNQLSISTFKNILSAESIKMVPVKVTKELNPLRSTIEQISKEVTPISSDMDSIQDHSMSVADNRIKQVEPKQFNTFSYKGVDSVQRQSLVTAVAKLNSSSKNKGWVAGVSINYHLPLSHQEMSTVNMNGKQNALFDYLPSIYVQYHFSEKWYLSSELGWINPQYTPNLSLFDHYTKVTNSQKQENEVSLNKLYYLNIPVSIHYQLTQNLYLGGGIEYSYLKRSILTNEQCIWEQQGSNWVMTKETESVSVNANPHAVAKKNNRNGNGTPTSPVDSVAQSFRSHDWRALVDVNYKYHRFELGMNFAMGLTPYIQIQSGSNNGVIKDRNEALQLYLRYNLFDQRRKH